MSKDCAVFYYCFVMHTCAFIEHEVKFIAVTTSTIILSHTSVLHLSETSLM
jgi:hypothetical protein